MVFAENSAQWSFDTESYPDAKQMRNKFISLLYACATTNSDIFAAEQIYAELVGNVRQHAPSRALIAPSWNGINPTLTVHDEEKMFTHSCDLPVDPMQENGQGLFIVKSLAVSLNFKNIAGDGSKVCVVLPVTRKGDLRDLFELA